MTREGTGATSSDPQAKGANLPPLDASDPKILDPNGLSVQLPVSKSHHKNWLECVDSRKQPLAPAHVAHNSNTACIVSWIAMKLGRPLDWDHKAERVQERCRGQCHAHARRARALRRDGAGEGMRRVVKLKWAAAVMAAVVCTGLGFGLGRQGSTPCNLITLDPGHFHAALVQKFMLPGVNPEVRGVRARRRRRRDQHLKRVEGFNARAARSHALDREGSHRCLTI